MTSTLAGSSRLAANHPLVRGGYLAAVFCGSRSMLGELPGETTADIARKFVLIDESLDAENDYARTAGRWLESWPGSVRPTDGVCFVFTSDSCPHLHSMRMHGAIEHEHFVLINEPWDESGSDDRTARLEPFVRSIPSAGRIVLVGYGDQGRQIGRELVDEFNVDLPRVLVVDHAPESATRARADGFETSTSLDGIRPIAASIYTPLQWHGRLVALHQAAVKSGARGWSNGLKGGMIESDRPFLRNNGTMALTEAAARALHVRGWTLESRDHGLDVRVSCAQRVRWIVRDEARNVVTQCPVVLGSTPVKLFTGGSVVVNAGDRPCLGGAGVEERLERAYISVGEVRALDAFAARSFCADLWPAVVGELLPSEHPHDMGRTTFERVLRRHIDRAEYVMASQSTVQQVMLGCAARRYAAEGAIVEIGSALGGSGLLMAAATDASTDVFVSIDPSTGNRDIMRFAFEREGLGHRLRQLVMTSALAMSHVESMRGRMALLMIDGLHTHAGITFDWRAYAPLVRVGGGVLIHDVEPARYSVLQAFREEIARDPRFRLVAMADGLAVMERIS